jgi:hypothetical protein
MALLPHSAQELLLLAIRNTSHLSIVCGLMIIMWFIAVLHLEGIVTGYKADAR